MTLGGQTTSLTYDYENRVTGITYPSTATNSFTYNGANLRAGKVDSGGTFTYLCDGTAPASPVLKDGAAVYTPGISERRSSTTKYYHGDMLGSTKAITGSTQTVSDTVLYDAFGQVVNRTGTTPTPFQLGGGFEYQTDEDSDLQLLGNRYYDSSVGRFISKDPIGAGDNWYAYCDNNPLNSVDPQGLQSIIPKDSTVSPPADQKPNPPKGGAESGADLSGGHTTVDGRAWYNTGRYHLEGGGSYRMDHGPGNIYGSGRYETGGASVGISGSGGTGSIGRVGIDVGLRGGRGRFSGRLSGRFDNDFPPLWGGNGSYRDGRLSISVGIGLQGGNIASGGFQLDWHLWGRFHLRVIDYDGIANRAEVFQLRSDLLYIKF